MKHFATLFEEFKCDKGYLSMIFYPLYCGRRFAYISGLYLLEDYPLIQVIMNSSMSCLTLIYLFVFKPFKEEQLNKVNICTEFTLTILFALSGLFLLDLSEEMENFVSQAMFWLIIAINIPFVCCLFCNIISACKKKKKTAQVYVEDAPQFNATEICREEPFPRKRFNYNSIFVHRVIEENRVSVGNKNLSMDNIQIANFK